MIDALFHLTLGLLSYVFQEAVSCEIYRDHPKHSDLPSIRITKISTFHHTEVDFCTTTQPFWMFNTKKWMSQQLHRNRPLSILAHRMKNVVTCQGTEFAFASLPPTILGLKGIPQEHLLVSFSFSLFCWSIPMQLNFWGHWLTTL